MLQNGHQEQCGNGKAGGRVVRRGRLVRLTVPILESGLERAMALAESMDARGFARFAADIASEAAQTLAAADQAAVQGVNGQASLQEVVGKLMAAERTLQTAIALRDRFVASLQEISRMQI